MNLTYFKTEEEIRERLNYLDSEDADLATIINTIEITDQVEDYDLKHDIIIPELLLVILMETYIYRLAK